MNTETLRLVFVPVTLGLQDRRVKKKEEVKSAVGKAKVLANRWREEKQTNLQTINKTNR